MANFFQTFFFQEPPRQPVPNAVSLIAGAKIPLISYSPNFLHTFLQKKIKISKSRTIFTSIYKYRYRELKRGGEGNLRSLGNLGNLRILRRGREGGIKKATNGITIGGLD